VTEIDQSESLKQLVVNRDWVVNDVDQSEFIKFGILVNRDSVVVNRDSKIGILVNRDSSNWYFSEP
jgi:hypothetical protein